MRNSHSMRNLCRLVILCAGLGSLAALPLLTSARSSNSINIVNNSSRVIRYVYLSHVSVDDWSGDKLGGNGISPGQSSTVGNISCDQPQIKVIAEDEAGCFSYGIVDCGGNVTWTITSSTLVDCGN